jgi:asparagine synthetase B (glutamine-hydrolysing)
MCEIVSVHSSGTSLSELEGTVEKMMDCLMHRGPDGSGMTHVPNQAFFGHRRLAYEQEATLHKVTEKIDEGEVIDTEKFTLNPNVSYCENETISYNAGIRLLKRTVEQ